MEKFTKLKSIAAPLPMINVDTDTILPKQHLRVITRNGLGKFAFQDLRYNGQGRENPDFVLNREPYRKVQILITGENFGCGSSREHAPWALLDFGLRCIIAPSFADIFYNNCFKNGILPVVLPKAQVEALTQQTQTRPDTILEIDLEKQIVKCDGLSFTFEVDPFRKHCLLNGLDEIGLTLEKESEITAYEQNMKKERPWL